MAKHRDLANVIYASTLGSSSASKIWRTVVFAGAMLAAPMGCSHGKKPEPAGPTTMEKTAPADDKAADDKAAADKAAADKAAADKEAADKAAADQAAKEEADKKAADELAAKEAADKEAADKKAAEDAKKKRPRSSGKARPTGRGFILS